MDEINAIDRLETKLNSFAEILCDLSDQTVNVPKVDSIAVIYAAVLDSINADIATLRAGLEAKK